MKRIQTAQELYSEILKSFYLGVYRKGDKLKTYKEIHETYGLSKDTIGRTFTMLSRDGFIQTNGSKGTFVTFDINNPDHVAKVPLEWPNTESDDNTPYNIAMTLHTNALYTGLLNLNEEQLQVCKGLIQDILGRINASSSYYDLVFSFWMYTISSLHNEFLSRITDHFISRYIYLLPPDRLSPEQQRYIDGSALKYYKFLIDAIEQRDFEEFPAWFELHYHNCFKYGGVAFSKLEDGAIFKEQALYEHLLEDLIIKIMSKEVKIGDSLPTTKKLCEEYGVSTTTVIRAYGILADMGFISRHARSGTKLITNPRDPKIWKRLEDAAGFYKRDWRDAVGAIIILSDALCKHIVISTNVVQQMHNELSKQYLLFEHYAMPFSVSAVLLSPLIASLPIGIANKYYAQLTDTVNKIITLCTIRIRVNKEHGNEIYHLMLDALETLEQGDQPSFAAISKRAMLRNFELLVEDYDHETKLS